MQKLLSCFQSLLELINSTACINKLLLAGKEGVALRANFNSHFSAFSGLSRYGLAASALDRHFFVIRMDSGLHFIYTSLYYKYSQCTVLYHKLFGNARVFEKNFYFFRNLQLTAEFVPQMGDYFFLKTGNIGL